MPVTISTGIWLRSQPCCDWEGVKLSGSAPIGYA